MPSFEKKTIFAPSRSSYYTLLSPWSWTRQRFVFKVPGQSKTPCVTFLYFSAMTVFGLFNFVTKRFNLYCLSSCRISPTEIHFLKNKQTTAENSDGFSLSWFCLPLLHVRLPVITSYISFLMWHCTNLSDIKTNVNLFQTQKRK